MEEARDRGEGSEKGGKGRMVINCSWWLNASLARESDRSFPLIPG